MGRQPFGGIAQKGNQSRQALAAKNGLRVCNADGGRHPAACPAHRAGHGPHLRDKLARVKGIALAADIPRNVLKPRFVRNREGRIGLGRYFEIIVDRPAAVCLPHPCAEGSACLRPL